MNSYFIPDGFAGDRLDAALAKMTGLSRSRIADLIASGDVYLDGVIPGKSDRVNAGAMVMINIPAPASVEPELTPVEGMGCSTKMMTSLW